MPISLDDRYRLDEGRVFLGGIHALVRLVLDQARHDARSGLRIGSFVTGYPGSPLGGYDLALQQAGTHLAEQGIIHRPAENEELAATSLLGTQLLERYPHSRYDGVTGFWYGKGPGLDRAGDALRHGNFGGTSRHGAVVVLSGEDHEAKSSTLPYEQEYAFAHAGIPVLYPSSVEEFLTFGRLAVAMSRFSGLWVAMKLVGQLCDGGQTVDLARTSPEIALPDVQFDGRPFRKARDAMFFPVRSVETERQVFTERHPAALAYVRANGLDRVVVRGSADRLGLLSAGKSYADLRQALADLGLAEADLRAAGVRLIKLGSIYPVDEEFVRDAAKGLDELVVVEEKRGTLEEKVTAALYPLAQRPVVYGKRGPGGEVLFPVYGAFDADVTAELLAPLLRPRVRERIGLQRRPAELAELRGRDHTAHLTRAPNYCSGCPHNVSTTLLPGQVAWGAPGCHVFAALLDDQPHRGIDATFQLGGEGAAWIGLSPFTDLPHIVQNQGDGSLFHSSYLNIRYSVAAGVTMTYKILFNGYVANTGAQPAVGATQVPQLTRMLALEGVAKIAIIAADPAAYRRAGLPRIARVHRADEVEAALADLAATDGVTIFLYDGECANERRRRRKRGTAPAAERHVLINPDVCENCGDCGEVTNCMSLHKVDTEFGPKTAVHQSSCNQDTSCLKGDCPSFLTVTGTAGAVRPSPPELGADAVAEPERLPLTGPYHVYLPGVGGTGVLTLNSLLAWAALIDGHDAAGYDQTGAAQKWGAVLSSLIVSPAGAPVWSNKVGMGRADLYLATDLMAAADPANLDRCTPGRTAAVVNTGLLPSGTMVRDVDLDAAPQDMAASIATVTDPGRSVQLDAKLLAERLFGDYLATNVIALGAAYQAGLLPISARSIEAAITLNGTALQQNLQAFRYGRLAVADPARVERQITQPRPATPARRAAADELTARVAHLPEEHRRLLAVRIDELVAYQDHAYAARYVDDVLACVGAERERLGPDLPVTLAVIRHLHQLMAYKDEYEVARLHLRHSRADIVARTFGDRARARYQLHPPVLRALGMQRKIALPTTVLDPAFAVLAAARRLRGTPLDPFGRAKVRVVERELIDWYRTLIRDALAQLTPGNRQVVLDLATLPAQIRGYEDIKLRAAADVRHRAEVLRGRLRGPVNLPIMPAG